jgi:branched-chain amino acid transport system substrate-binding protein
MKRKGASSITVAALFVVGLIIGGVAVYALARPSSTTNTVTTTAAGGTQTVTTTVQSTVTAAGAACYTCLDGLNNTMLTGAVQAAGNLTGTFTIGNLVDLTSALSGEGTEVKSTTAFALQDINAWLQTTTLAGKVSFNQNLQDYALDNTKATNIMNSYITSGIHVTIGPLNSGTAGALLPFANSNHIVMISESSTNPNIAIPGDFLFRTPPSDNFQGIADAAEFVQSGVKGVIIVYRNDGYGAGLANSTAANFKKLGGDVVASIPYDTTTSNYIPILGTINDAFNTAVGKYGAAHVGLYFVSFNEFGNIAVQASKNYPTLLQSTLPWFGTDGEGNEAPLVNTTYAAVAAQSRLVSSYPGFSSSALTQSVCARQLSALGILCDGYSTGAYDDMWIAALSILYCHGDAGPCIQKVIAPIASGFVGATGVPILNSAGDRLFASYVFFCIVPGASSGTAKWIVCGTWDQATNAVNWSAKPSGIP